MTKFGVIYPQYAFREHDPILDSVDTMIDDVGIKRSKLATDSHVSATTLNNWHKRKTKRPQFATVMAVVRACGGDLVLQAPGSNQPSHVIIPPRERRRL